MIVNPFYKRRQLVLQIEMNTIYYDTKGQNTFYKHFKKFNILIVEKLKYLSPFILEFLFISVTNNVETVSIFIRMYQ